MKYLVSLVVDADSPEAAAAKAWTAAVDWRSGGTPHGHYTVTEWPHTPSPEERVVVTDYHAGSHRPYRACLHSVDEDEEVGGHRLLDLLVAHAGARDGDEVAISARRTGARPFGDRRVVLVAPHTYEREPKRT